jgi:hypothetical protein
MQSTNGFPNFNLAYPGYPLGTQNQPALPTESSNDLKRKHESSNTEEVIKKPKLCNPNSSAGFSSQYFQIPRNFNFFEIINQDHSNQDMIEQCIDDQNELLDLDAENYHHNYHTISRNRNINFNLLYNQLPEYLKKNFQQLSTAVKDKFNSDQIIEIIQDYLFGNKGTDYLLRSFNYRIQFQPPNEILDWVQRRFFQPSMAVLQPSKTTLPIENLNLFPALFKNAGGVIDNIIPHIFSHLSKSLANCVSRKLVKNICISTDDDLANLNLFSSFETAIFSYVDLDQLDRSKFKYIKKIYINQRVTGGSEFIPSILNLKTLKIFDNSISPQFSLLERLTNLEKLKFTINNSDLSKYMELLPRLTKLKSLDLTIRNSNNGNLRPKVDNILLLTNLKRLNIQVDQISHPKNLELEVIPNDLLKYFDFEHLRIKDSNEWNSDSLKSFTNLTKLKINDYHIYDNIHFQFLTNLNSLSVSISKMIKLERITSLFKLTRLELFSNNKIEADNEKDWSSISNFKELKVLNLNNGNCVTPLRNNNLLELTKLEVIRAKLDQISIRTFMRLTNLTTINGYKTNLSRKITIDLNMPKDLLFISLFSELKNVEILTPITFNEKIPLRSVFGNLNRLKIDITPKSRKINKLNSKKVDQKRNIDLPDLLELKNLSELVISRCIDISVDQYKMLHEHLPNTDIVWRLN